MTPTDAAPPLSREDSRNPSERPFGVIDIGSNSIRLVVFAGSTRSPAYMFNEKVLCGLGRGLQETGVLNPEGKESALVNLRRFASIARAMGVENPTVAATAAVRDASDGREFAARMEAETGLVPRIVSGPEEGRLSALGVLMGAPDAEGVAADLGGASLELIAIGGGGVGEGWTGPLGPLRLEALKLKPAALDDWIDERLRTAPQLPQISGKTIYCVGGAWRALARIDMTRRAYPLHVLHEYDMSPEQALDTALWAARQAPAALKPMVDSSSTRLATVPFAARVLSRLIVLGQPARLRVSATGLREGLLFETLSEEERRRDPLLEAAAAIERETARFPGFGDELGDWLAPLYPALSPRLLRAASRLSDTAWRAHPDYRAEACFELMTRPDVNGASHQERAFLTLTLLHRHKGGNGRLAMLRGLLSPEAAAEAETLGKGMRLGAVLAASTPGVLPLCPVDLHPDGERLRLRLHPSCAGLRGEAVEKRLSTLASAFRRKAFLEIFES
ncbi:Ppx/GppA family phosphatase [Neomegalonema sp.]|uniref:Ppx/GppA family phosphatase n=1 Tax=Neomegalonema sp. TaxID=2039713 RepID=UPI00263A0938|nr:Ppx/GppA family phosphatase [Neomegalonema sp.]MDD2867164.1 Ppx/GppA family phosphatase [Neomegalonema sp.]